MEDLEINDYYISAHGSPIGSFTIPSNVRIIMLCAEEGMTACPQNDYRVWI